MKKCDHEWFRIGQCRFRCRKCKKSMTVHDWQEVFDNGEPIATIEKCAVCGIERPNIQKHRPPSRITRHMFFDTLQILEGRAEDGVTWYVIDPVNGGSYTRREIKWPQEAIKALAEIYNRDEKQVEWILRYCKERPREWRERFEEEEAVNALLGGRLPHQGKNSQQKEQQTYPARR